MQKMVLNAGGACNFCWCQWEVGSGWGVGSLMLVEAGIPRKVDAECW